MNGVSEHCPNGCTVRALPPTPHSLCTTSFPGSGNANCALGEFTHRIRYLNNVSRKGSAFEAPVNTVPWWRLLGEEVWRGVIQLGAQKC